MPKVKRSLSSRLMQYVSEYKDIFSTDGKVLFCQPCGKSIKADQRSQVTQHLAGTKHLSAASRVVSKQVLIGQSDPSSSHSGPSKYRECFLDLCRAFISADIPVYKVNNADLRNFLVKYTNFDPPDESTLRKHYLPKCYEETLEHIRKMCENEKIWVCIDETTDSSGRKVGNVVVGVLKNDEEISNHSFLLACREMSAANHITIARLFNESMHLLWPNGVKYDRVLLLLTDAASYMKKAAEGLSVSYPKMIHVTCIAHALHRVCENIRALYPNVDKIVSNGKKVFVKSPKRIDLFKKKCPNIPLPPTPVVTRWGTWLAAVVYYANNFENFKSVVEELDKEDASSIEILQNLLNENCIRNDLAYISANFSFLCDCIKKLEETTKLLPATVKEMQHVESKLSSLTGPKVDSLKNKFRRMLQQNLGFQTMCKIAKVLEGQQIEIENVCVSDIPLFKYARLTSCDVERTFSQYKALFRDNRQRFVMKNLEMTFVVHCNRKENK